MGTRTTAGELILAIADGDLTKTSAVLRQAAEGGQATALLVQLASVAHECMRMVAGDDWRDVLNYALLEISLEEDDGADTERD
ncbi:hypothetical protein [Microbacterium marinilacus]|uniref:Uncharacterized protein n=1 Tax=Microbacterium marinilacus TaxID=415209 RepID=A0ABP7BC62_9MICO|nr:hypothetical protein [Microbacterium marinilacus]MBY0687004.1 hypothetical protein [Microbacterium marinilacus]